MFALSPGRRLGERGQGSQAARTAGADHLKANSLAVNSCQTLDGRPEWQVRPCVMDAAVCYGFCVIRRFHDRQCLTDSGNLLGL